MIVVKEDRNPSGPVSYTGSIGENCFHNLKALCFSSVNMLYMCIYIYDYMPLNEDVTAFLFPPPSWFWWKCLCTAEFKPSLQLLAVLRAWLIRGRGTVRSLRNCRQWQAGMRRWSGCTYSSPGGSEEVVVTSGFLSLIGQGR